MRNDTPSLASSDPAPEIEVILAGNLAADDLMWIVRCSARELQRFFLAPAAWVAALATLPDWEKAGVDGTVPAPVLIPDFALLVQTSDAKDPDGWLVVQGISRTNEVTVLASRDAAVQALHAMPKVSGAVAGAADPFAPFWAEAAGDGKLLLVNVVRSLARAYAHYEILDPGETLPERAARMVAFLLAVALDPTGCAAMMSALVQRTLYIDGAVREPGPAIAVAADGTPSLACANVLVMPGGAPSDAPLPQEEACLILDGPYDPNKNVVIVDGVIIKRYGVEDGP